VKVLCLVIVNVNVTQCVPQKCQMTDLWLSGAFLQRVSIACYAERCISHSKSVRLSVRLSVCPSHAGTESKRLNLRSRGLHWRIAPWL